MPSPSSSTTWTPCHPSSPPNVPAGIGPLQERDKQQQPSRPDPSPRAGPVARPSPRRAAHQGGATLPSHPGVDQISRLIPDHFSRLLTYGNYAATRQAAYLRLAGATGLLHSWRNDDLTASQTTSLTGTWHLATASYDGHGRRLYLDGVPFAADAPANVPGVVLANLALGQTNGTERLVGSLANVAIYPYALTPAQVGRHYALGEHSPAPTPVTSVVQYTYDTAGRVATIIYPDLRRETHSSYDPAGRPTGLSLPDGTNSTLRYNAAGQRTEIDFPNGGKQLWAYDGAGRPHDTWWQGPGSTVPFTQTATLDAAGQRTVLQDTAGSTTYGYDGAGRLTSASYPGGSTEADQYDGLGDRTVITSTTVLSGTAVTTNTFDAAAQLKTSAVAGGGQPGTTTYSYDGNGAQTGSSGPAGVTTNTFNWLSQLTHVSGPATSETFVYDGQGDRLRAYDQSTANYQLHTLTQDLRPGGMSGLLSDGAADYGYADFGIGAAPVARMDAGSSQGAYLASDLLGSVRLATNPGDQTLGSGSYDAWGNARPVTPDANGQVLLAGLQASAPFGYAGQQYDAGPATYSMRARQYDPATGRFQSADPQAPSQGYPVTLNPYQYAGDMVTGTTDPSGRGWVFPGYDSTDYFQQSAIGGFAPVDSLTSGALQARTMVGGQGGNTGSPLGATQYWVPVLTRKPDCVRPDPRQTLNANIVSFQPGGHSFLWDVEHVEAVQTAAQRAFVRAGVRKLLALANTNGVLLADHSQCQATHQACTYHYLAHPDLRLGPADSPITAVGSNYGIHPCDQMRDLSNTCGDVPALSLTEGTTELKAWGQEDGLLVYSAQKMDPCADVLGHLSCFLAVAGSAGDDVATFYWNRAKHQDDPYSSVVDVVGALPFKLDAMLLDSGAVVFDPYSSGAQRGVAVASFAAPEVLGPLARAGLRRAGGALLKVPAIRAAGIAILAARGRVAVRILRDGKVVDATPAEQDAIGHQLSSIHAPICQGAGCIDGIFDLQAAYKEGLQAEQQLLVKIAPDGETMGATADGAQFHNGYATHIYRDPLTNEILPYTQEDSDFIKRTIEAWNRDPSKRAYQLSSSGANDGGVVGRAKFTHAEIHISFKASGKVGAINRVRCNISGACKDLLPVIAYNTQSYLVFLDPKYLWIYQPNGGTLAVERSVLRTVFGG